MKRDVQEVVFRKRMRRMLLGGVKVARGETGKVVDIVCLGGEVGVREWWNGKGFVGTQSSSLRGRRGEVK